MLFLDACSVLIRFHPRRRAEGRAHRHSVSDLPVLIERICRADPQALAEIFDRQVDRVYAIALKRLRCRHEAEDVCSEVFDRIWRRAEQFDPARGSVEAWIATIARNASLDRLRRQAREPENDAVDSYEVALLLHADPDSGPEQWVDQAAFQRAAGKALGRLSDAQRRVVSLAFLQGLTHEEISRRLRMPLGTVKSHCRRGLNAMRAALNGYDPAEQ
jgi:RNA polymerase sigma-70 factor (ECF subfamily)